MKIQTNHEKYPLMVEFWKINFFFSIFDEIWRYIKNDINTRIKFYLQKLVKSVKEYKWSLTVSSLKAQCLTTNTIFSLLQFFILNILLPLYMKLTRVNFCRIISNTKYNIRQKASFLSLHSSFYILVIQDIYLLYF